MEYGRQRDFSEFCEQLTDLRTKFRNWDSCEKTVALYYLMVGLPFANARFLQNALNQLVTTINTPEAQILENSANDPEVIKSFLSENPQSALCLLLNHLPLLRPGNKDAARCYLNTIRRILTEFITPPFKKIYNECVEIMSYVYIHPAFDKEDKTTFKHLLKQVLNKVTPENFIHSPVNEGSDDGVTPNPEFCPNNKKRSNSLTPRTPYASDIENWPSQENLVSQFQKPRSYSLSCDKNVADATNIHSSSSETKLEEIIIRNNFPIMKSILSWLKSLRLHKYSWIFHNITSSQMLNLSEEYLTEVGVTKGARQKLLLNLQKLKNRSKLLTELEIAIMNGNDLHDALKELKGVLQSPMQITVGDDLCSQFVKVMGKVCTQLLMLRQPSDDNLVLFNSLCEKAESLECFTLDQKKKLNMWKEQLDVGNVIQPCPQRTCCRKDTRGNQLNPLPTSSLFELPVDSSVNTHKSSSYPNMQTNSNPTIHRHSVDSVTLKNQLSYIKSIEPHNTCSNIVNKCNSNFKSKSDSEAIKNNYEIENSLESLCIQMMEHALGP